MIDICTGIKSIFKATSVWTCYLRKVGISYDSIILPLGNEKLLIRRVGEFFDYIDYACGMISSYGAVLESRPFGYSSLSDLPCDKDEMKKLTVAFLKLIQFKEGRDMMAKLMPEWTNIIYSKEFYDAVQVGYLSLATFILEEDAKFMNEYYRRLMVVKDQKPSSEDMLCLAKYVVRVGGRVSAILHTKRLNTDKYLVEMQGLTREPD